MKLKDDPKAYAIMGCAMRVHDTLGNGFLESAYADALELEFKRNSIPYVREDEVYIYYRDTRLQTRYRADFTCFDRGYIIELKAIKALTKIEKSAARRNMHFWSTSQKGRLPVWLHVTLQVAKHLSTC